MAIGQGLPLAGIDLISPPFCVLGQMITGERPIRIFKQGRGLQGAVVL